MGSAPSKSKRGGAQGGQQPAAAAPIKHPGNEEGAWGLDDPEAELRAALGGLVQVLSSSLGWTWAMVVDHVFYRGVVPQPVLNSIFFEIGS